MNKQFFAPLLPYLAVIGIFAAISVAYFIPEIFENKSMITTDGIGGMGAGKEIADYYQKTGERTLWTNGLFGGMPTYQIAPVSPSVTTLRYMTVVSKLYLPEPASYIFLLLFGAFLLFIALGANLRTAVIGAIAYAFSSYFFIIIHAGHIWKVWTLAYIPATFAGIIWAYRGKYLLGGLVAAAYIALQLLSNHPQMTYYFGLLLAIYLVGQFVHDLKNKSLIRFTKASATLVFAGIIAFAMNSTNLYHSWQYSKYTMRGPSELTSGKENLTKGIDRDYATNWSYGIGETFTLIIPNTKGGASGALQENKSAISKAAPQFRQNVATQNTYWGDQPFTEGPVYAGAFIMFLFIFGLFVVNGRWKWTLLAGTVLSILLSWGHNFMWFTDLFLDYVPLYDKFRTVSSILVIAELTIPMLAILAMIEIIKDPKIIVKQKNEFFTSLGFTAGLTLLFIIYPHFFSFFSKAEVDSFAEMINSNAAQTSIINNFMDSLEAVRVSIFRSDAWRSLIIILAGAGMTWFFAKRKIKPAIYLSLIAVLTLFDMATVNKRYLNSRDFKPTPKAISNLFPKTAVDEEILKDTTLDFRVFNLTVDPFNDATTSFYHKSVGGYHPAKMRRYQDLIERHLSKRNFDVINMLNTKYIIVPGSGGKAQLRTNPDALGNTWFVDSIQWVDSPDREIEALDSFNPAKTAIIDKRFQNDVPQTLTTTVADSASYIKILSYAPNHQVYESSSVAEKLAVFSEIYYAHGWHLYIDGKEAPHLRANYVLRAAPVPAGKHRIEFKFAPLSHRITETSAYAATGVLILMVLAAIAVEYMRHKRKQTAANTPVKKEK